MSDESQVFISFDDGDTYEPLGEIGEFDEPVLDAVSSIDLEPIDASFQLIIDACIEFVEGIKNLFRNAFTDARIGFEKLSEIAKQFDKYATDDNIKPVKFNKVRNLQKSYNYIPTFRKHMPYSRRCY